MKKIEGWFTYVEDFEYGPTLVRWNKEGKSTHPPKTSCDVLTDEDWDEVFLFDDDKYWHSNWSDEIRGSPICLKIIVSVKQSQEDEKGIYVDSGGVVYHGREDDIQRVIEKDNTQSKEVKE